MIYPLYIYIYGLDMRGDSLPVESRSRGMHGLVYAYKMERIERECYI